MRVAPWFYDLLYSLTPGFGREPRRELVEVVRSGRVKPSTHPRALDLGCGTGRDTLFLAQEGFDATGVDFSARAVAKANAVLKGTTRGGTARFVHGDLRDPHLLEGESFDFLFDGGSLDDLQGSDRRAAIENVHRWARPRAWFLLWCFFGARKTLPWLSFTGPSRLGPGFDEAEIRQAFGNGFEIERLDPQDTKSRFACFLMHRRER